MTKTKINVDDLEQFASEMELVYASEYGNGKNKKLTITGKASYRVYNKKELVFETEFAFFAIEKYERL